RNLFDSARPRRAGTLRARLGGIVVLGSPQAAANGLRGRRPIAATLHYGKLAEPTVCHAQPGVVERRSLLTKPPMRLAAGIHWGQCGKAERQGAARRSPHSRQYQPNLDNAGRLVTRRATAAVRQSPITPAARRCPSEYA